jgi:hypothetical protein
MSRAAGLSDIALKAGESFGEDTALAFDPASGFAALQYNHYGPRTGAIEDYLYAYDLSLGDRPSRQEGERDEDRFGFKFGALLKHDAAERLRRMGIIHEIEFSVSVPGVRAADLEAGRSLSVRSSALRHVKYLTTGPSLCASACQSCRKLFLP